jgi:enoyl-CoA hydratase/carnithine racemase
VAVVTERHDRVLVVRIEREEKRNATEVPTAAGLDAALNRLEDDPELRAGVLTGTDAVFSAGTDLNEEVSAATDRRGEYGVVRRRRAKPLIAAVEGPAFGGGFEIVLACDLVVASTTARFALPESRRGLVASSGGLFRAMRSLPLDVARELLLTGAELGAERAHQLGLVNRVTAPGGAVDGALAMAREVCVSSPASVRETLAALNRQHEDGDALGWGPPPRRRNRSSPLRTGRKGSRPSSSVAPCGGTGTDQDRHGGGAGASGCAIVHGRGAGSGRRNSGSGRAARPANVSPAGCGSAIGRPGERSTVLRRHRQVCGGA